MLKQKKGKSVISFLFLAPYKLMVAMLAFRVDTTRQVNLFSAVGAYSIIWRIDLDKVSVELGNPILSGISELIHVYFDGVEQVLCIGCVNVLVFLFQELRQYLS